MRKSSAFILLSLLATALSTLDPFIGVLPASWRLPLMVGGAVVAALIQQFRNPNSFSRTRVARSRARRRARRSYRHLAILAAPLLAVCLFTACFNAAQGIYAVAGGLDESVTVKRELAAQKAIGPEAELSITRGMLEVNRAMLQVTDKAACFENFTQDVKAALIDGADDSIRLINGLYDQGALRIKSQSARQRYEKAINYLRVTTVAIRTALVIIPAREANSPTLTDKERQKLEELRAKCREAAELLRKTEGRLNEDLARLGEPLQAGG